MARSSASAAAASDAPGWLIFVRSCATYACSMLFVSNAANDVVSTDSPPDPALQMQRGQVAAEPRYAATRMSKCQPPMKTHRRGQRPRAASEVTARACLIASPEKREP